MASLGDYMHLKDAEARAQWSSILLRRMPPPGKRQVNFAPVETVLCYGLFLADDPVVDPHRYGGGTMHTARHMGIGARRLPDFLRLEQVTDYSLLGLEDFEDSRLAETIEQEAAQLRAAKLRHNQVLSDAETTRIVEHRARVGHRAFATEVLRRFDYTCGFCGMAPHSLRDNRLLVASHIKPWADSNNRERRDPRNGVAACPTHDAAFDKGLITVNGGLRVHRSRRLRASLQHDEGVEHNFGESLREALVLPQGIEQPRRSYLRWHHEHIYQDSLP